MISKKYLFNILFFGVTSILTAQTKKLNQQDHNVNQAIKTLLVDKDLKNASIGFLAKDVKTGEIIAELNPDLSLMPASTQKLVTTAAALEVLGKNYKFTTHLQYSGDIDTINRVLKGNIYIHGGSDPTLGSKYFDKEKRYSFFNSWITAINKHKIDSVAGFIIGDASRYSYEIAPPKWAWEDVGNYYGAGANGLTVFDNLYEIHFQSPALPDKEVKIIKIDPEIPGLSINNEVLSSNIGTDEAFIFGSPYTYNRTIRGTIPKAKSDFEIKGAIPDPAYYLAWLLNQKLIFRGLKTSNKVSTIRLLALNGDTINEIRHDLHVYYSPSLQAIIDITNKKSINLFAEHLLNEIGYKLKHDGSNNAGYEAVTEFWKNKGMDTDGFFIYDGSGLSRTNSVTASQLVFILTYMKTKSKN
ncbi:MAG: D-alanyl-D-alanine carboxypeptidase/D-alanyl-D-alanine-endopeptidase, partial [Bacteroidales bacterium]|nr:D-alanyl-D-alanine carboxypeptidase/D-alanyl-D-alanine-endopeptidase [Bacteroidales bacterium]